MAREEIRAIIRPTTLPSEERDIESRFTGPDAGAYADLAISGRGDKPKLVAVSLVDAYEMAFGEKCPYVGSTRDSYIRLALEKSDYDIEIVSPQEFSRLLKNQKQIK